MQFRTDRAFTAGRWRHFSKALASLLMFCIVCATNLASSSAASSQPISRDLYASLSQTSSGGVCGTWSIVPSPNPAVISNLKAVTAISSSNAWAFGSYNVGRVEVTPGQFEDPNPNRTLALHWDGKTWRIVPAPDIGAGDNYLEAAVAVSSSDVWAVGHYNQPRQKVENDFWRQVGPAKVLILHWNGKAWSSIPTPDLGKNDGNSRLTSIAAVSRNDVWAAGYFGDNNEPFEQGRDDRPRTLIMHWNGAKWSVVPSPNPGSFFDKLYSISAVTKNDIWASGAKSGTLSTPNGGTDILPLVLHWDGKAWTEAVLPENNLYGDYKALLGIKAFSTSVLSVGEAASEGSVSAMSYRHSGRQWLNVGLPSPQATTDAPPQNSLTAISATSTSSEWAVGSYATEAPNPAGYIVNTFILHWNGKSWTRVPSPNTSFVVKNSLGTFNIQYNELAAIATLQNGDSWAVGSTGGNTNLEARTLIMRFKNVSCNH